MNNAAPSSTLYVQASPTIGIAVDAKKREQFPIGETASVLCNAILELKSQVCSLTSKLTQLLEETPSSETTIAESDAEQTEEKQMLTIEEAAKFLSVGKHTVYKMTAEHRVRFYKPTGKRIYFDVADLIEWMKSRMVKSNAETEADATNYVMFGKRPEEEKKEVKKKPDDERTIRNRQIAQEIRRKYKLG